MTVRSAIAAAMLLCASPLVAMPAIASPDAVQQPSVQQRGALPRGGTYVLDPDPSVAAAAVGLWFRAPGNGFDGATPGIARIAATAAAVTKLDSGKTLFELVHSTGGDLTINVYPDIVGIGAVIPSSAARRVVAAMTAAYFAPSIDEGAVQKAERDAAVLAVQQRYTTSLAVHDVLFRQLFASGPAHDPPIPDQVSQIARISPADVSAFAKRAFRSSNAVLTLTGNVDVAVIGAVTDGSGSGAMDPPFDSQLAQPPVSATADGSVDGLGMAWVGPPISDEGAATALDFVADYLFRDGTGVVSQALARSNATAFASGQFITLHDPGVMLVTIGGDNRGAAKTTVLAELAKLASPLDARTFAAAREAFLYHIASDTQTPPQQADNLGWYAVEGAGNYAPGASGGAYERAARALDPQFVASVVRRYLKDPVVVNLVTGPKAPAAGGTRR